MPVCFGSPLLLVIVKARLVVPFGPIVDDSKDFASVGFVGSGDFTWTQADAVVRAFWSPSKKLSAGNGLNVALAGLQYEPRMVGAVAVTTTVTVAPAAIGFRGIEMVLLGLLLPLPLQPLAQVHITLVKSSGTLSFNVIFETGSLATFLTVRVNVTAPPANTFGATV